MDIQFGNVTQLNWLWLAGLALAAVVFAAGARRQARMRFATANLIHRVLPTSGKFRTALCATLVIAAMSLMVLALVDVRWGKVSREVPQKGIEVMFVLDVSRSMLAEDASPNRLERAKQQIKDVVDEMAGDRIGLVVFAGDARQQIPLTTHYDDFKQALDEVGPHNVRRGGSRLGDALEVASTSFLTKLNAHKAIVVFTDGEDQESDPVEIAKQVHQDSGVRIFTVGLGDMDKGARIPLASDRSNEYLQHDGEQVWSKLHGEILRQVAVETDGAYIPAGTKQVNMADVYHGYIADVEQMEFETAKINQYEARFQWFLAPALLLLLCEIAVSTWPERRVARVRSATTLEKQSHVPQPKPSTLTPEHSTAA
ncbi:VWA domain-containing protein [Bythopirellula goksoeyrii]|uniref:von Willebrand factor type A domain protein n=1 Tax=Bythopirellula goksoeyrii TaxID=1400387 RepID=A0A5B9QHX1_9BACT|nr:VWA domain-containing protein [Bythopirellula goksoeyrii]QEG37180.1 von Willebrand factor type A domain protein [Bythopirellula goksoeyrii]